MSARQAHLYLARLVLQARTPLSVTTGVASDLLDTQLVRDANDLPGLPGTSVAGVLRHLYRRAHGEPAARALFGDGGDAGSASPLQVSWGCLHGRDDRPVQGLLLGAERRRLTDDPLLALARQSQPVTRDHVAIDHRGTARDQGKFDRCALPAGYRFSVELALWSEVPDDPRWSRLLALPGLARFRLGGASRRGLGSMAVVRAHELRLDLTRPEDFERLQTLPEDLGDTGGFAPASIGEAPTADTERPDQARARVSLEPEDFWRFGQGRTPVGGADGGHDPDLLPVLEPRVVWRDGRGELELGAVVAPASAIKGAIAHRVAFHYNCLTGRYADTGDGADAPAAENPAVTALFGRAAENGSDGQAGRVLLDDLFLGIDREHAQTMMHNAIDRFTGGVRTGALYSEQLLFGRRLVLDLTVLDTDSRPLPQPVRRALARTLDDLKEGRLALGAGSGRGHGYFSGTVEWTDNGAWIREDAQ